MYVQKNNPLKKVKRTKAKGGGTTKVCLPKAKSAFAKTGENISYSRRVARAHYKSDSTGGENIGNSMFNFIKNKNI